MKKKSYILQLIIFFSNGENMTFTGSVSEGKGEIGLKANKISNFMLHDHLLSFEVTDVESNPTGLTSVIGGNVAFSKQDQGIWYYECSTPGNQPEYNDGKCIIKCFVVQVPQCMAHGSVYDFEPYQGCYTICFKAAFNATEHFSITSLGELDETDTIMYVKSGSCRKGKDTIHFIANGTPFNINMVYIEKVLSGDVLTGAPLWINQN